MRRLIARPAGRFATPWANDCSETFRRKVEECFSQIEQRIARCIEVGIARGHLPKDTDARHMAKLLVNCWEGAALRSRMLRDAEPLKEMLDFYFRAASS